MHTFIFTAKWGKRDTIPTYSSDIYIPILTELDRLAYSMYRKQHNVKIDHLFGYFKYVFETAPLGNHYTNIHIKAPEDSQLYISLGGIRIECSGYTTLENIPVSEYHSIWIDGELHKEGDTVTITYDIESSINTPELFEIAGNTCRFILNLYCFKNSPIYVLPIDKIMRCSSKGAFDILHNIYDIHDIETEFTPLVKTS
jgi:hypothetical protein